MEEDNDSEDIPLLLRSERRKQKVTGSRTSLMEVTLSSVKTSHPMKRSISVHDISTNKENTKIPNKSIEVDRSASLPPGNRSPGVQERSESSAKQPQTSQQTNNAAEIGTELPSNTSNTDKLTKSPTQITVSLRNIPPTNVNNMEDHLNITRMQTQETENYPQLTKLATETENWTKPSAQNVKQVTFALDVSRQRIDLEKQALDKQTSSSDDTKDYKSLMELISRNSQKAQHVRSGHRRSRSSTNKGHMDQDSKATSSSLPTAPAWDGNDHVKRRRRATSDESTLSTARSALPLSFSPVWRGNMKWGDYLLQDVTVKPLRESVLIDEIRSSLKNRPTTVINSYFSQQHLSDYIRTPPEILQLTFPADSVPYGKLRNFLSINNVAGLIPVSLRYSFAVVPYTFPLVAKETIDPALKQSLFLVHIALPSVYPDVPSYHVDQRRGNDFGVPSIYGWHIAMRMYAIPSQVMTVPLDKSILIVDEHPDASKVRYAAQAYGYKITSKPKDPNLHTVLIHYRDFPHVEMHQLEDMKRPGVRFLLIGHADLKMSSSPVEEVFPERSGGYVTTGVDELVRHPEMLTKMIVDVEELNGLMDSSIPTPWQIIFPDDIFDQIASAGQQSGQRERSYAVRWELVKALEEDKVYILSSLLVKTHNTTNQWMDRVAQAFAASRRYFVHVSSEKLHDPSHHVSVVEPQAIISRFKPMTSFGSMS